MPLTDKEKQRYVSYSNKLRETVEASVDTEGKTEDEIKSAFEQFSKYHLHILESGEFETILTPYGVSYVSDKKVWIELAMNKIQEMTAESISQGSQIYRMIFDVIIN